MPFKTVKATLEPVGIEAAYYYLFPGQRVHITGHGSTAYKRVWLVKSGDMKDKVVIVPMTPIKGKRDEKIVNPKTELYIHWEETLITPPALKKLNTATCTLNHFGIIRQDNGMCDSCHHYRTHINNQVQERQGDYWIHSYKKLTDNGVNVSLVPARSASDYYALSYLARVNPKKWNDYFHEWSENLAKDIFNYTYMVVGGEARHMFRPEWFDQWSAFTPKSFMPIVDKGFKGRGRQAAWVDFLEFDKESKEDMLKLTIKLFNQIKGPATYGGDKWAKIAEMGLQYLTKEVTPVWFVDNCWGMHHNGNIYFDKLYPLENLKEVLQSGRDEDMKWIMLLMSPTALQKSLADATGLDPDNPTKLEKKPEVKKPVQKTTYTINVQERNLNIVGVKISA